MQGALQGTVRTGGPNTRKPGGAPLCHGAGQHFRGGLYFDKLVNILKNVVCNKMSVAVKIDPSGNWKFNFDEL